MNNRAWTSEDNARLLIEWGDRTLAQIGKVLDRTPCAVRRQASALKLGPGRTGTKSLALLARETGYHPMRIRAAAEHLRIQLRRAPIMMKRRAQDRGRAWGVTPEQEAALVAFLTEKSETTYVYRSSSTIGHPDEWRSRTPPHCITCKGRQRPHLCHGDCVGCYELKRNAGRRATRCAIRMAHHGQARPWASWVVPPRSMTCADPAVVDEDELEQEAAA